MGHARHPGPPSLTVSPPLASPVAASAADIISAVEFDETGRYLATGDRGGRVVLFEREDNKKGCQYRFWTEFQSHDPEFDYLKSIEIEEKINKIRWCKRSNSAHFLLSTNGTHGVAMTHRRAACPSPSCLPCRPWTWPLTPFFPLVIHRQDHQALEDPQQEAKVRGPQL